MGIAVDNHPCPPTHLRREGEAAEQREAKFIRGSTKPPYRARASRGQHASQTRARPDVAAPKLGIRSFIAGFL